ncbi:hypothetical protein PS708_02576 [Pseudomonas fluorescens]|nr:hypothetical protein PS708_02576 [Pseudomonas fluorescens]
MSQTLSAAPQSLETLDTEYQLFSLGQFSFSRDNNFAIIRWPGGVHYMHVELFLSAMVRDLGWEFLYGWIFFDDIFGTINYYGKVEVFAGTHHPSYKKAGIAYHETFDTEQVLEVFQGIANDWINEGYDPLCVPRETGSAHGPKGRPARISLTRGFTQPAKRMLGLPGDAVARSSASGQPISESFKDLHLEFDRPQVKTEPGFEGSLHAVNVFDHIARSEVTWIPSTVSSTRNSLFCMSSEEHVLPVTHGNDRPEWFIQLTDEIHWTLQDKETGAPLGRVAMRPGDVCAMPADIRHKGFAPKRAMLLVLENSTPDLPPLYANGTLAPFPVEF